MFNPEELRERRMQYNNCPECGSKFFYNETIEFDMQQIRIHVCERCNYCSEGKGPNEAHKLLKESDLQLRLLLKRLA